MMYHFIKFSKYSTCYVEKLLFTVFVKKKQHFTFFNKNLKMKLNKEHKLFLLWPRAHEEFAKFICVHLYILHKTYCNHFPVFKGCLGTCVFYLKNCGYFRIISSMPNLWP